MLYKAGLAVFLLLTSWSMVFAECEVFEEYIVSDKGLSDKVTLYNVSELAIAVSDDNATAVSDLIQQGCDINYNDITLHLYNEEYNFEMWISNTSVLHVATQMISKESLKMLLEFQELDVNAIDSVGETPMHMAAAWGLYGIIKDLHNRGADVNAKSFMDDTPLQYAASWGYYTTVLTLIELGADIDVQEKEFGESALMSAASWGYKDVVEILIEKGADLNLVDEDGWTALDYAIQWEYPDIAEILVAAGAEEGSGELHYDYSASGSGSGDYHYD